MHYSEEFLATQKAALLESKSELEAELAGIASFDESAGVYVATQPDLESGSPEEFDQSSDETEIGQTNQALIVNASKSLEDVNDALAKMESGEYGVCESSGEFIGEDRLRAYPAARTCEEHSSAS